MSTATKLGAYVIGLAAVFTGAVGAGSLLPDSDAPSEQAALSGHSKHDEGTSTQAGADTHAGGHSETAATVPGGLQVSQDGYTLVPQTTSVRPDETADFKFTINGPDGRPVTRYAIEHGKPLHLIVARRDLSGFQHVHPVLDRAGVWSVPLELGEPGAYRVFTDFKPEGAKEGLTLGTDVTAPGDYQPEQLPKAETLAQVDGYEVRLNGSLVPGKASKLTLQVSKDGKPVTDLQPYLEAYGHLVALRSGDLAYLHVHPEGEPGDGKTRPGPDVTFYAEVPSPGAYRLYLDFQHEGKVRTAEFTAVTSGATLPAAPPATPGPDEHGADGHTH